MMNQTEETTYIPGEMKDGVNMLPRIKVGNRWFWIDERLKEYRSVDAPLVAFTDREMDDLCEIEEVLNHPITLGFKPEDQKDRTVIDKLQALFNKALGGDRTAFEAMEELQAECS
ncbi:MAG: hypothetical protein OI715_00270 (plasmid) [Candidatus Methanoperedens sp.]|nr:MAG: hypothetical protein OI715_00270 [Candidatus Methanoperedens sp.]